MFNNKKIKELTNQLAASEKSLSTSEAYLANAEHTLLLRDRVANALGVSHGGKRDVYEIYGYPQTTDFRLLYRYSRREGIANRIVFGLPKSCWRDGFNVYTDDTLETPVLEDEINQLKKKMIQAVIRADALNRVGRFSALFVGVPDMSDPREPIGKVRGDAIKSIYFRPFAYDGIEVFEYDMDTSSPRFGLPLLYQLQVRGRGDENKNRVLIPIIAHYSRVVHICEDKYDSEIEGIPALESVFNNILNIEKITGGSAEAYFRNARGKTSFEVDPEFGAGLIDNPDAKQKFDDSAKAFTNNWQDQIISLGAKVTTHNTPHASPLDTVKVNLWEISSQTGMRIRILTGEGAGAMAGSEDKLAYNVLVDDRQDSFCRDIADNILEILNNSGAIDLPKDYYIDFPKQDATTEAEQVDLGFKKAQTIKTLLEAASAPAGDGLDIESAFTECYLQGVEVDDVDIDIEPEIPAEEL